MSSVMNHCGMCNQWYYSGMIHQCVTAPVPSNTAPPVPQVISYDIGALLNELVATKLRLAKIEDVLKLLPRSPPDGPDEGYRLWEIIADIKTRLKELGI